MKTLKTTLSILLLLILPLSQGCIITRPLVPESGHFYINPNADFATVGKTVVFELDNRTANQNITIPLTNAIRDLIQKKHIFSLRTVLRRDQAWRDLDLEEAASYSIKELAEIRKQLKADAVIFGYISQYIPYPHMMLGLHLKMVDLRTGQLLWALEQVWDSTDRRVERRMKIFYERSMRDGYEPFGWRLMITSPKAFNKFVVDEVAQTLPEGNPYIKQGSSSENLLNFKIESRILKKTLEMPGKALKVMENMTRI